VLYSDASKASQNYLNSTWFTYSTPNALSCRQAKNYQISLALSIEI
jgi:hypothetical protein